MTTYVRTNRRKISATVALAMLAALAAVAPRGARADSDGGPTSGRMVLPRPISMSVGAIVRQARVPIAGPLHRIQPLLSALKAGPALGDEDAVNMGNLGGARAPASSVVVGGGARGFQGIDLVGQANAGTGKYSGTGGILEPPDQALCVGNGFVVEGVNQAFRIYTKSGHALTPPILAAQFFNALPGPKAIQDFVSPTSFLSDPKCIYDAPTKRFFVTMLEIDQPNPFAFGRSHNYIAVSKTSDPTKDWWIYKLDITDDGLMGTPFHLTCPCLGDQPLIGADAHGFYMSTNEYSEAEIVPIQPPPVVNQILIKATMLPNFRNGQAQVYAMSKSALIHGSSGPVVQFDTASIPVTAGAPTGSLWSSLQPAFQPPGDRTALPAAGVEYFMSQLDFAMTGDNRVAVWALTNTASLNTRTPKLNLLHTIIRTTDPTHTYTYAQSADQKAGPMPIGSTCLPVACDEEKLNANDDRMNQVMLANGHLWSAVNTLLPPIKDGASGPEGDPRNGIMYFDVQPSVVGGTLRARMRDGYVNVPRQNVLFPSIAASSQGPVVVGFSVSGLSYFPSTGWARLDGLAQGEAPVVHVSGVGRVPEDGFTGYCLGNLLVGLTGPLTNLGGLCTDGRSRWGDYSASVIDEQGCAWTAAEYISGTRRDDAGNWSTYVTRVPLPGCP